MRYLRTGRRRFASFITWVSLIGLGLGVLVLTVVVSVMNGFDAELKDRLLGAVPHVLIEGLRASDPDFAPVYASAVSAGIEVERVFDFFMGSGMVTRNGGVNPVSVYAVGDNAEASLTRINQHMRVGSLEALADQARGVVLGAPLARHLSMLPGDPVALILSEPTAGGIRPRLLPLRLVGTFELGAELDYSLAIVSLAALDGVALHRIGAYGTRMDLADPLAAPALTRALASEHPHWRVTSWADNYGELFQAVRLEKIMMFLTLLMVVAVAAFNIVSGQMMVVSDKRSAIAILRTMGAHTRVITRVFLLQGVVISSVGIGVGLLLGVAAAYHIAGIFETLESWLGIGLLDGTYFVELPSVVKVTDLAVIAALSWSLCLASAWFPARRAALMNPLEGLHQG